MERINKGIGVWFTDLELWALWQQAKIRQDAKKGTKAKDKRSDRSIDNYEMHYIGLKGEYAFQKVYGTCLSSGLDWRGLKAGDSKGDFKISKYRVEVKTLQDWLIFNDMNHFGADIAVLVNPFSVDGWRKAEQDPFINNKPAHNWRHSILVGWCWHDEFKLKHFTDDFGYGPRLCMKPEQLRDVYDLFKLRGRNG